MVLTSKRLIYLLCISFLCSAITEADSPFYQYQCSNQKTFTPGSAYEYDRSRLLHFLSSNATGHTEFYNTTVAGTPDAVYGSFMCWSEEEVFAPQMCYRCVNESIQQLLAKCPTSKEAIIWYEECFVRYSNRYFFSTVDTDPMFRLLNDGNIIQTPHLENFKRLLFEAMNETADEAAKRGLWEKKRGTKEVNVSGIGTLFCISQCTPDLWARDCRRCLSDAIVNINWSGEVGGRVVYPSCKVRFALYPFYRSYSIPNLPPANSSSLQGKRKDHSSPKTIVVVVVLLSIVVATTLSSFTFCFLRKKMRKACKADLQNYFGSESTTVEALQFSLTVIEAATNKFSHHNRIGKGGFGEVYKGILSDGREIAVKRLSRTSKQGVIEFKNEILLIAKLQHRNLVALLGFCLEEEEKILVYEYVPNKSLDYSLFGSKKRRVLNWVERYKIIGGVARGILYLHEHSRLKVIHRDLKPSNILLDNNVNPKISDFGLARMVAIDDELDGRTKRIVGTYGYMSPEYAMFGKFSEKSDVFSFGVIVLEIVSGKKNGCAESQYADGLLSYAWKQWKEEKWLEIMDSNMIEQESYSDEVIKCIKIGLLCVQENPDVRPSMNTVVQYLSNDSIQLPFPQEPAFFLHGRRMEPTSGQDGSNLKPCSPNEMSLSKFFPR